MKATGNKLHDIVTTPAKGRAPPWKGVLGKSPADMRIRGTDRQTPLGWVHGPRLAMNPGRLGTH